MMGKKNKGKYTRTVRREHVKVESIKINQQEEDRKRKPNDQPTR